MRQPLLLPAVSLLLAACAPLSAARAQNPPPAPPRVIEVVGTGEVRVTPDEITLVAGVETYADALAAAKQANDERMQRVLALTGGFEMAPEDVQTSHMSITPRYEFANQTRFDRLLGFTCNKQVVFKLRDSARLDELVGAVLEAGANELQAIDFGSSQLTTHRAAARRLALVAAREKAAAMAAELEQQLGRPLRIQEQSGGWMPPRPMANIALRMDGAEGGGGPTFALGQITVSETVHVTFELE